MPFPASRRARDAERDAILADLDADLRKLPPDVLRVLRTMARAVAADGKPGAVRPRHEPEVPPLVPPGMETKG